ncbi:DUF4349 domain-containing protein [Anaeromassilibacillus sp. SJQ-5]
MFKRLAAGLLALLLCLGAAGCAGAAPGGAAPGQKDYGSGDSLNTDEGEREAAADRKLIKTVELELETRTYDAFMDSLNAGLAAAGGYVQQSDIRGGAGSAGRYGSIVLRVPADKLNGFLEALAPHGTVLARTENVQDVTMDYVDVQSRLKALRTEQEALLALLEKATSLSDILTLQEKLTGVRGDIESYETKLRTMETLVAYSTVTLRLSEVEKETVVEPVGIWQEIGVRFSDSLSGVGHGLRAVFVWFVGSLPYLLLIAAMAAVAILVVRLGLRRSRRRRQTRPPYAPPAAVPPSADVSPDREPKE